MGAVDILGASCKDRMKRWLIEKSYGPARHVESQFLNWNRKWYVEHGTFSKKKKKKERREGEKRRVGMLKVRVFIELGQTGEREWRIASECTRIRNGWESNLCGIADQDTWVTLSDTS